MRIYFDGYKKPRSKNPARRAGAKRAYDSIKIAKAVLIAMLVLIFLSLQYLCFNLPGREFKAMDVTAIAGERLSTESFVSIPDQAANLKPALFQRSAKPVSKLDFSSPCEKKIPIVIYNRAGYLAVVSPVLKVVRGSVKVFAKEELAADEITVSNFIASEASTATAELAYVPDKPAFDPEAAKYYYRCVVRLDGRDVPCELWVLDKTPPAISGTRDLVTTQGSAILFRDGVTVSDNYDENPKLVIESEAVSSEPGTYPVTYRAVDESGNESVAIANVTVVKTEETFVYEKSDEILAQILNEGMNLRQKATAVYQWVKNNMRYAFSRNETDPILSAYEGFNRMAGNCYTYYAISEALLTRAGIQNMHIERPPDFPVTHHWNLVKVEEGWYHFDAYPAYVPVDGCLFTDSQAVEYAELQKKFRPRYYDYVKEDYPAVVQ